MPLIRIDVTMGQTPEIRRTIGDLVHDAMVATLNVPPDDRFQIISEHDVNNIIADPAYLNIKRSDKSVFIQVTLNEGRTIDQKKQFYKMVADKLHESLKVRREDVLINLVEVKKENWSFGNGEAQYA